MKIITQRHRDRDTTEQETCFYVFRLYLYCIYEHMP